MISTPPPCVDGTPNDGVPREDVVTVALPLTIIYIFLATLGVMFALVCLAFNFIFRERKCVPFTSR